MNEFKFKLGENVVDILTGFRGKIANRANHLNNGNKYGVIAPCQPDNKCRPEIEIIDEGTLILDADAIERNVALKNTDPNFKFNLGDKIKSTNTNLAGFVERRVQQYNEVNRYWIISYYDYDCDRFIADWMYEAEMVLQTKKIAKGEMFKSELNLQT